MKRYLLLVGLLLLAGGITPALAQERVITGRVTNAETGQPLAGAQVSVAGTSAGTLTNSNGQYSLPVPAGASTLTFSSIGFRRTEVPISGSVVNASLQPQAVALEGLVVTALGIERQERSVGVAAQQLDTDQLTRAEPNIVNSLNGKVSGVKITNAGPQGGSSRIVIRGASSITGDNQPLFIIDGVPVDNSAPRLRGYGGFDYGNAVQDINPENIESITVLKGPNAAALYGSRAANGAILITTKSGRQATSGQITASQVVTFEDPLRLPDYQDVYGQGVNGVFEWVDGNGGGTFDYFDESWGPRLDGRLICQFNSPRDEQGNCVPTPWVPRPDNVRNFFETGRTLTTNAAFAVGSEAANARLSLSRTGLNGMVPGFELERISLGLTGGLQLSERFRAESSVQYVTSEGDQRPGIGYEMSNPMIQFVWFGRQVDVQDLRENYMTRRGPGDPMEGMPYSWNYRYHPNPYYVRLANRNADQRDRLIGNVSLSYEIAPWVNAFLRTGTDWYQDDRKFDYAQDLWGMSGFNPRVGADASPIGDNGAFGEWNIGHQETNTDFLLNMNPTLSGPFSLNASVGASRRDFERDQRVVWVSNLIAPGIYSVTNAATTPESWDYVSRKQVNSLLGQAELGFNDYLFLNVTGRNDWSSTLPEDNRSYFYPSVSTSFVFTDAIPALQDNPVLGYGKLRASWARVGNDTDPYNLRNTYVAGNPFQGFPTFSVPNTLANAELRPEQTESWEVGTELGFFNNRVTLDATYYSATTSDQIMPVQVSRASGYTGQWINAGAVRNRGIELLLGLTPVETRDFRWQSSVNFARNRNTVVALAENVTGLQLPGGSFWGVNVFAREGEPYGQIMGNTYQRDSQGRIVVNSAGLPVRGPVEVIGNYNPDWTAGLSNTLTYRGINLSFLLDMQRGGDVYSVTHMFGRYAGVLEETLEGRCAREGWASDSGMPACNAETGIVVPGVKVVNGDTVPNDIVTNAQSYNWGLYGIHEAHVFDASFVKLREVALGYELPSQLTSRLKLSGMNVSLIGRNLGLWTDVPHIDPETAFDASNVQGFEFGQLPTARSIGFSVSIRP